uniref:Transient receptor potential cation channel subfamily M member 1 n=1 Tax=Ictidomys tridecemlineatus TaxID=43179 RepID=A0A287CWW7_ICTTR
RKMVCQQTHPELPNRFLWDS